MDPMIDGVVPTPLSEAEREFLRWPTEDEFNAWTRHARTAQAAPATQELSAEPARDYRKELWSSVVAGTVPALIDRGHQGEQVAVDSTWLADLILAAFDSRFPGIPRADPTP